VAVREPPTVAIALSLTPKRATAADGGGPFRAALEHAHDHQQKSPRPGWPPPGCPAGHRPTARPEPLKNRPPKSGHRWMPITRSPIRPKPPPRTRSPASQPRSHPPAETRERSWAAASVWIELRPRWLARLRPRRCFLLPLPWPMARIGGASSRGMFDADLSKPRCCQAFVLQLTESTP